MGEAAKTMAQVHAEKAEKILASLSSVGARSSEVGIANASMANAHALLALYYQGNAT